MSLQVSNFQFRTKSIIQYYSYALPSNRVSTINYHFKNKENREKAETYSGQITKGSKKRLQRAISLFVQSTRERQILNPVTNRHMSFRYNFITLTMPASENSTDAKYCHKHLLQPFLRTMRRKYGLKNYVWKCELQKNNNVHYHITTDTFIHYQDLRNEWNHILDLRGMLDNFKAAHGHSDPNSTDIKKVQKVKDMEAYLIKYVCKEDTEGRKINAKVWDCSTTLKQAKYFTIEGSDRLERDLYQLEQKGVLRVYSSERFAVFKFKEYDIRRLLTPDQYKAYHYHMSTIRNAKELYYQNDDYREGRGCTDYRMYLPR